LCSFSIAGSYADGSGFFQNLPFLAFAQHWNWFDRMPALLLGDYYFFACKAHYKPSRYFRWHRISPERAEESQFIAGYQACYSLAGVRRYFPKP